MANPEHLPEMTRLDSISVTGYRIGLTIVSMSSVLFAIELLFGLVLLGVWYLPVLGTGAALTSANLHLYDPKFRWFFPLVNWFGFVLFSYAMVVSDVLVVHYLQIIVVGCFLASAGMLAVKEYFCFKIPGLPLTPLLLFLFVLFRLIGYQMASGVVLGIASSLLLWLALAKWRMPLHFDIGDKNQYSI